MWKEHQKQEKKLASIRVLVLQSTLVISNLEGTGQKVQDSESSR